MTSAIRWSGYGGVSRANGVPAGVNGIALATRSRSAAVVPPSRTRSFLRPAYSCCKGAAPPPTCW